MELKERIQLLSQLGDDLRQRDERLLAHIHRASVDNPWFTSEFLDTAVTGIADEMLRKSLLESWTQGLQDHTEPKRVGLVMAGNLPLVGFHDFLCVFITGNVAVIKLSEKDRILLPYLIKRMTEFDARTEKYGELVEKMDTIDAIIATGSNNSARYFEYYFAKYPNIIRRNRNAVAVLDGHESGAELSGLADDVFLYFGQGCRNVAHCFIPRGYDFTGMVNAFARYEHLALHNKYKNNLDYNLALLILNKTPYIGLHHLLLVENVAWMSPISCLYYSYYDNLDDLRKTLQERSNEIQCVVSRNPLEGTQTVRFGSAQHPKLDEYADGVNTLEFLKGLQQ